ncbi:MAG: hypothetical protein EOP19_11920, partial [Hyphomicrobiales bacterium]
MALESTITAAIKAVETGAADLAQPSAPAELSVRHSFANGSGANQASKLFSDSRTLAASGSEDLDLAGVLAGALGGTITFASVKAIMIRAKATNANNVVVGPAASNGFLGPFGDAADRIAIRPGGVFLITAPAAGWAVTSGTGDLLAVANSGAGTPVDYD